MSDKLPTPSTLPDPALLPLLAQDSDDQPSLRRPGTPGERFFQHVLAVSELYVTLAEATRDSTAHLVDFRAEPAAWMPNSLGACHGCLSLCLQEAVGRYAPPIAIPSEPLLNVIIEEDAPHYLFDRYATNTKP